MAVIGRQLLLLEVPEEAAEPAQFAVQGVVRHGAREAQARAAQRQDEGRMGGEAFEDVPCVGEGDGVRFRRRASGRSVGKGRGCVTPDGRGHRNPQQLPERGPRECDSGVRKHHGSCSADRERPPLPGKRPMASGSWVHEDQRAKFYLVLLVLSSEGARSRDF